MCERARPLSQLSDDGRTILRDVILLKLFLKLTLEHVLRIKTMTSLILDHVATAYLYLGINTGEKVMILFVLLILELSQD
jgi:hypothetical protein